MFIDPTITWVPSGFSGYIWLDTKFVFKKTSHTGKLWFQYSTATLPIHPLHDTPDKQSLANLFFQFFNSIIERIRSKFPSSDSPIPISFQSFLHIYLISIKPLSRKFIVSFFLLNVIHLIKSIPCLNLFIFIPATFVVFFIIYLFMQQHCLLIHSFSANLIISIHSTMPFLKLIKH